MFEEIIWMPQLDKRIPSTPEDKPSTNQTAHWIFHSPHNVASGFAKFVLFYEVDIIDKMWEKAKYAIDNKLFSDYILYGSCSTRLSAEREISPRILLTVSTLISNSSALEEMGRIIADYMNYQSSSGYLYCKIDPISPSKNAETLRIKCRECKDMQFLNLEERKDWETDGYKSNLFCVEYKYKDFAKTLGAEWDPILKRWTSPTLEVWKQMIRYFAQI
jgi:hypothetical protein